MIVADTNLLAYLLIEGERTPAAIRVLEKDAHWVAPFLWRSEFRNVLASTIRHGGLDLDDALRLMERAEMLLGGREVAVPTDAVLDLASASGYSAYDCEFVALALRACVPLVTSDKQVLRAFPKVAQSPESFLQR